MVALSSMSHIGANLYLEIRRIELRGESGVLSYSIKGIVGDGCHEALVEVELSDAPTVRIIPICNEDASGSTLDQHVDTEELSRLILDGLNRLYFCVEAVPKSRRPGMVSGYADNGRLYHFHDTRPKPHTFHTVSEHGASWLVA